MTRLIEPADLDAAVDWVEERVNAATGYLDAPEGYRAVDEETSRTMLAVSGLPGEQLLGGADAAVDVILAATAAGHGALEENMRGMAVQLILLGFRLGQLAESESS